MAKHGEKRDIALLVDSRMLEKGLTAKKLADECGVTEQTVNNWRNGTIPKSSLKTVAEVLDLSIEELLTGHLQTLDGKAESRLERKIKALSHTTGASECIVIGLMMLVAWYVTGTINLLFGEVLEHSVGYFVWVVLSAVFVFGGAHLVISGLRKAEKTGSQQTR